MKQLKTLILLVSIVLGVSSCGTVSTSTPFAVSPKMEITMQDLTFLGESEISCDYDTYLGFIRSINTVNGEMYNPGNKTSFSLPISGLKFPNKALNLAAAKILKDYPEAEYVQVVMEKKSTDVLFLGSSTQRTAKVRVYKFAK